MKINHINLNRKVGFFESPGHPLSLWESTRVSAFKNSDSHQHGFALLIVIPILLILSMTGLLFLQIVTVKTQAETDRVMGIQAKYLAKSALQLAQLEIQPRTELKGKARKNQKVIEICDPQELPASGKIVFGEEDGKTIYTIQQSGKSNIFTLDLPLKENLPPGVTIYLLQDWDGDGVFGTIAPRKFMGGIIEVTRSPSIGPQLCEDTLTFWSQATIGVAQSKIECVIALP